MAQTRKRGQKTLKIALINTFDIKGGAARAAYRLHSGLRNMEVNCRVIAKRKSSTDEHAIEVRVGNIEETFNEAFYLSAVQRYYIDAHRTEISNTIYSLPYPGIDISKHPKVADVDIINLHWVAWYQSPITLSKLFSLGKPVVWTLHDQWAFTGGCHYSAGCKKYLTDCSRCPQLADDPFDLAAAVLKDKADFFKGANLTIVTPSRWLASCAKESTLFRDFRVEVIPNSLETDIFVPIPKAEAKEKLGIKADDILLLFGAEQGNEKRKGFHELVAAMQHCMTDVAFQEIVARGMVKIMCFGIASAELESIGLPVISLGYLNEDKKICEAYSAADLFVLPSLEDNLPNTMLEALSCATPVVAFSTGGIPAVVVEGETGMLAPTGDSAALGRAIATIVADPDLRRRMGQTGRERMVEDYSLDVQARKYLALFDDLPRKANFAQGDAVGQGTSPESVRMDTTLGPHFSGIYEKIQRKSLREAAPAIQKDLAECKQAKAERDIKIKKLNVESRQTAELLKARNETIVQLQRELKEKEEQFRRKSEELIEREEQFKAKLLEVTLKEETYEKVFREQERLLSELFEAKRHIKEKDEQIGLNSKELANKDKQLKAKYVEVAIKEEAYQRALKERENLSNELAVALRRIDDLLNSRSWRITKPLRAVAKTVRGRK